MGVSLDPTADTADSLPRESGTRFPIVWDAGGKISERYNVNATPHTVVITRSGKIEASIEGYQPRGINEALRRAMEQQRGGLLPDTTRG